MTTAVDMLNDPGFQAENIRNFQLEFDDPPGGQSITKMSGILENIEFKQVLGLGKAYGDSIVLRWGTQCSFTLVRSK